MVLLAGVRTWLIVTAVVVLAGGLLTWLVAPSDEVDRRRQRHDLRLARLPDRPGRVHPPDRAGSWSPSLVLFFFGTLLFGLLPALHSGVSWQAHVCGFVAGVGAAALLHHPRGGTRRLLAPRPYRDRPCPTVPRPARSG